MKTIAGVLFAALLLLTQAGGAVAQTSDYERIESFKQRSAELRESLKAAQHPAQAAALGADIDRLETEYAPHRKLLADGLYPGNLDAALAALREESGRTARRIALAEESRQDKERIAADAQTIGEISRKSEEYRVSAEQLTLQVAELSGQIQKLTEENTGLVGQIKVLQAESRKDKESIAKLRQLTDKLNANIRDRDALVLKMMDGMFKEYSKAELTDQQRQDLFVSAQRNDYVGTIVATLDGNVKYAEAGLLTAQDVKLVREQQQKVSGKWEEIKPLVARLYQDEQARTRDIATVDTRVAAWKKGVEAATWKSVHQVFASQNVDIGPFTNATEFHDRLVAYLDAQVQDPSRERYKAFKEKVWDTPLKDQWLPVIPAEELTAAQRGDIEQRVAAWGERISAILRRGVLIGLAVMALLVTAVILLRRKKQLPVAQA